ncbi:unnamed protein product [Microthlaspi erraticum]|uniref:DUF7815 domain-containing protein n=1 Tax=Microthlaspi erraticum TaxID=1685480 RepID=A0A6D2KQ74_9BRAS|nr:unnamed protein product [Microthlaspi erraticum]
MATEISLDLINQLKVSLRKEAKLSSFDPVGDSSTIPSLPTAAEAIAEIDASAPYLRCRSCKGKLLRGIESLICVFCGKQQRTSDNPPDPIKLTSTSGYKWFLSSLNLDGSEMVEPLKETNGSSRGAKAPVVKGIAVSKFLDLEIQWSAIEEKSINNGPESMHNLRLGGLSVDDYFVEGRGDLSKVDPAASKPEPVEDDFNDPRSLSLFDSVKTQGVVESQQSEKFGLFKGEDAQKNVSSQEEKNLSLFAGRDAQDSVSSAEQGNFGFFEEKDAHHSLKKDENLSLFEGKDAQRTSSSKNEEGFGFFESKDAQRNSYSIDDESFGLFESKDAQRVSAFKEDGNLGLSDGKDGQKDSSSKEDGDIGLFEGAPSSNAGLKSFDDKVVASSSDWDSDFQSVSQDKSSGDPFVSSPVDLAAHMDSVFGSGKDFLYEKPADSSAAYVSKAGDWLQDDLFGNVTGKTQSNDHDKNEGEVVGGNGNSSMDIDWIGDDLWQTSEKKPIEKTPTDDNDDDDDDDWNDFASSANSKTPNIPLSQSMESSQEEIFGEKQSTGTSMISDIAKGGEDDLFGTWDSFTSSVQPPANNVNSFAEKNPEMNLSGANNNHRDLDSDLFSESIGGQASSVEVKAIPSGTSTLERTCDPDGKDQTLDLVGTTTISPKSKSDVAEELMSQMHDLSFMLETELSVPQVSKTE